MPLALITGASTGIGEATALRLSRNGWTVLAGVRDAAAADRLAQAAGVIPLTLDVTSGEEIAQAAERVRAESNSDGAARLDALVNNAGIGVGGPLETIDLDELRRQFEVNVIGAIAVTQALLPALREARGRIVFTSSIGGKISTPFIAPYAASKHAIEAFGDALRLELRTSHVRVALIEPGSVTTPIWDKARAEAQSVEIPSELQSVYGHVPATMGKAIEDTARRGAPPDKVAQTIERALTARRMKARYPVGSDARPALVLRRILPDAAFDRILARTLGL
ncbi:MAG TPA: SDR family NAD(P)-dependent oxidoreductase [Solirubrobacteraceae bacterium]|jgi:NAD(P)-dependent dehydrogenase (short-subunit alcohol dehydrogenase family)|nr:SDR family NAD(P)-dependent oxidoreductase [Solirubrobacteraceae bacterium]